MATQPRQPQSSPGLLWGYLPLILVAVVVIVVVVATPSRVPDDTAPGGDAQPADEPADEAATGSGETASGWGTSVTPCEDREQQVDSGYSPPCFSFSGDNGGATHRGVTEDTIKVSYRFLIDGHLIETLAGLAGQSLGEDEEDLWRTTQGLVDYFNENFEFYGRRIELERFDGRGTLTVELVEAGQEEADNDALTAVDMEAFADVGTGLGGTQPYAESLTDRGVLTFGVPYMSRQWFQERAPYAWSSFGDCTTLAETAAQLGNERLLDEPAVFAGGDLNNQPRRLGVIHPNNREYTRCVEANLDMLGAAGNDPALVQNYTLDLGATQSNAVNIMAQLRDNDITSVACACDPLMVDALAALAEQQGYQPEWFILGVGFWDLDLVGQMIADGSGDQWSRTIGASATGTPEAFGVSEAYEAYKSVRDDEPSQTVDLIYAQLYRLAIGIQMAGPDLTPGNFQTGMFNYPGGTGALGAWAFSPDNYAGVVDARLVWWDPDAPSPVNGQPGTYADTGERFREAAEAPPQDEVRQAIEARQ
jgi:hypothetical protein